MKIMKMFVHYRIKNVELVRRKQICLFFFHYSFKGPTQPTDGYLQGCDLDQIDKCM